MVGCASGEKDEIDLIQESHPAAARALIEATSRQVRGVDLGDVALLDPGAGGDPIVRGLDYLFQIGVGQRGGGCTCAQPVMAAYLIGLLGGRVIVPEPSRTTVSSISPIALTVNTSASGTVRLVRW